MKQVSFGSRRRKLGSVTVAAGLGLLLLLGGCMSSYGHPEKVLEEADSSERSLFSSLFDGIFGAMMGTKAEGPSLIELEALKAQALEEQRRGIECIDCIPDGEGNMLPAALVHSIQVQNAKSHVNHSQANKKRTASISKEQDDHTAHEKVKRGRKSDSVDSSAIETGPLKLNFDVSSQRRQLSKSKNGGIIFPPIVNPPIVITCRCEYPSENIFPGGIVEDRFIDGILILPRNSIYCRNVDFICPDEDPPAGSIEWTCPNFGIGIPPIVPSKGKGKGKSKNSFVGSPCFGSGNIIRTIVNGGTGIGGFSSIVSGKSKCGKGKGNKNPNSLCCGKGKGNKNGNNCGCILPPVPTRPQYVILPPDDPDCADRPTPPPPTTSPPAPTPGTNPPRCEESYDEWRSCVRSSSCSGCAPIPSTPGGWLFPGEECNVFEEWFPGNYMCCPDCADELADFEECKDCNLPAPTPRPTPGGTAPPGPVPTRPDPECREPYEDWVNCVGDEECDDCDTSIPGRTDREAQTPGANCDAFVPWYLNNQECCSGICNPALDEFANCKDCDIPIPEEPTAAPSAEILPGKITGLIFVDVNGNGSRDPGEPGIPGVSVVVTDVFGFSQTVTTRNNGSYTVSVPAGPAVTNIIESTLPPGSKQTAGNNPSTLIVRPGRTTQDVDGFQISGPSPTPRPPTGAPPTAVPPTPAAAGTLTGIVYEDTNGNGKQDPGEPGIFDVDVVVSDSTGSVQTVQTRRDGSYTAVVPPGSVVVDIDEVTLPPGALQTAGSDPTTLFITPGGSASDEDGYQITGKVKGIVYEDANGNGRQDSGEEGFKDVDVVITDSNGDKQTVTTDNTGMYMAVVPVGRTDIEIIEETLPPGAVQTDGDNPTTVEVRAGRTTEDVDGYQLVGEVRGVVFEDTNGNGKLDSGEPGIGGVDVVINDRFDEQQTVTTRRNGSYSATVPAGPAVIDIDEETLPSGVTQTAGENPTDVDVPAGGIATDEDGYRPRTGAPTSRPTRAPTPEQLGKVKGVVFDDKNGNGEQDRNEPGLEDVEVVITDRNGDSITVTTNVNGEYSVIVPSGTTGIQIDEDTLPDGFKQTAGDNPNTVRVPAGGTATDEDGYQILGVVEGVVFEDTNGNREQDPGEPGLEDVEVVIIDSNGDPQTVTTNKDGEYSAEVPRGRTEIDIDEGTLPLPPGFIQTTGENPSTVDVPGGGVATDEDGYRPRTGAPTPRPTRAPTPRLTRAPTPEQLGKVKGVVFDDKNGNGEQDRNEPGLEDVEVVITDRNGDSITVTTNVNGEYSAIVPSGTTEIQIDEDTLPDGFKQTAGDNPNTVRVPAGGTATDEDGYQILGVVEGVVFEDTNGNREQDPGEPGLEDVEVVIIDSNGDPQTVTTNKDGEYSAEVPRGRTEIDIDEGTLPLPPGFIQTTGENPSTVDVPGGGVATDEDGYRPRTGAPTSRPTRAPTPRLTRAPTPEQLGKVKGVVFDDKNGNGEQDRNEPGLEDVEVVITDRNGDSITVTTNVNGEYSAIVPSGTTEIQIDEDTLPDGFKQTAGDNPNTVRVPAGGTATDEDGYQILGVVEGVVFEDTNGNREQDPGEPGLEDVEVVIIDSNGDPQTVTTNKDGEYSAEVPRGRTEIDIDEGTLPLPPGFIQTTGENPSTVDVPGGGVATDEDGYRPRTGAPTSRPTPPPSTPRPTRTPPTRTPPTGAPPTGAPPTRAPPTVFSLGKVKGLVFEDINGNEVRDPGEPGISGVDLVIFDSTRGSQTVRTNSNGRYSATVPSGPAIVDINEETLPEGARQTAGSDPTEVTVPAGGTATDEDGFQFPAPPTPVPQTPPTPPGDVCIAAEIMFDKLPDGTVLEPGDYISDQYEPFYGVTFSSTGKGALGRFPRLLDSTNPAVKIGKGMCGDEDLGAPNEKCPDGGPGVGVGGEPGPNGDNPYKNCEPLGNILIIQEDNSGNRCGNEIPDDNQDGGVITIDFSPPAEAIYELSFLDIDDFISVTVVSLDSGGNTKERPPIDLPMTGDNSFQAVEIQEEDVVQLRVTLKRSGAIPYIRGKFCRPSRRRVLGDSNELRGATIGSNGIRTASLYGMKTETAMERARKA